jgi:hypothetical protein
VAKIEDEGPDFDQLDVVGEEGAEEVTPAEEPASDLLSEELPVDMESVEPIEPVETEGEPTEIEPVAETESLPPEEPAADVEEQEEVEEPKEPNKRALYLEIAGAVGIPLILLAIAVFHVVYFSTALYLIAVGLVPYGIWKGRETNTAYSAILGCALIAVLTAVYVLWIEIGRYQFDIKASEAKGRAAVSRPAHSGPVNTTATA